MQMVPVLVLFMAVLVAADEAVMTDLSALENLAVVHCDASRVCPDYTTCCRNPFGRWACCPFPMVRSQAWSYCMVCFMVQMYSLITLR